MVSVIALITIASQSYYLFNCGKSHHFFIWHALLPLLSALLLSILGEYFLFDSGYANMDSFVAPYQGLRCQLGEYLGPKKT